MFDRQPHAQFGGTPMPEPHAKFNPIRLLRSGRVEFRRYRRTRPFWGAVILALGGYVIAQPVITMNAAFYASVGARGMAPIGIGIGMAGAAGVAMFIPAQRHFPAIMAMLLSIASLPLANLGGWLIGMLLGIVGSGLCFAWAPFTDKQLAKFAAKAERKASRKSAKTLRAAV